MKINEMIKTRRRELGYTQEQMAQLLGISAPAVNKWERGISYPDITLLPALARLLKTDLNTLLSFQEDLTEEEINSIAGHICEIVQEKGYEAGFCAGMDKLLEYPSSDMLIYMVSFTLEGLLSFDTRISDKDTYRKRLEPLYERIADSPNSQIRDQAVSLLISRYIEREDYDRAETLLETLPVVSVSKSAIQARLLIKKKSYEKAAKLLEHILLKAASDVQMALMSMTENALLLNQEHEAKQFADICRQFTEILDLMPYSAYLAQLDVTLFQKDAKGCSSLLESMLTPLTTPWKPEHSVLYKHLKSSEDTNFFSSKLLPSMIAGIEQDESFAFIREDPKIRNLLKQVKASLESS